MLCVILRNGKLKVFFTHYYTTNYVFKTSEVQPTCELWYSDQYEWVFVLPDWGAGSSLCLQLLFLTAILNCSQNTHLWGWDRLLLTSVAAAVLKFLPLQFSSNLKLHNSTSLVEVFWLLNTVTQMSLPAPLTARDEKQVFQNMIHLVCFRHLLQDATNLTQEGNISFL